MPTGKLMLIDGHSLANRAFYALPPLSTSRGQPTNAVVGFLNMLFKLIEQERPDYLAVAFDRSAPTFRHTEYSEYKAQRTGMPEDLRAQIPLLKEVLEALAVSRVELDGYEADDLIGTLARLGEEAGVQVQVVTGDRDALQLVSGQVEVLLTRKGISEVHRMTPEALKAEYGLEPLQIIDFKGLMGDTSDNIPGLPGVGEKTALKLLAQFGSVEAVLEGADQISGKKLAETVRVHADLARLSKRLATIDRAVPVEVRMADLAVRKPERDQVHSLFRDLELQALARRADAVFGLDAGAAAAAPAVAQAPSPAAAGGGPLTEAPSAAVGDAAGFWRDLEVVRCDSPTHFAETAKALLKDSHAWSLTAEEEGWVVALSGPARAVTLRLAGRKGEPRLGQAAIAELALAFDGELRRYWEDPARPKHGHDLKPLVLGLLRAGFQPAAIAFDTALAAYLLDANRNQYRAAALAAERGLAPLITRAEAPDSSAYTAAEAFLSRLLVEPLQAELETAGLQDLLVGLEVPLLLILAEMEAAGILVDREALAAMSVELEQRIEQLTQSIYEMAGGPFNVNSTRQLGELLFEKLGLPVVKKTKTGYSTDAEVLEQLQDKHPVVARVLEHRTLVKLKGTYVDGLSGLIDPETRRVHTTFNQMVAATGRLSSADPNLQNIPIRLEEGRRLRKVFVAAPGTLLFAADYSQIELRILAHIAGDQALVEAFWQGQDIHTRTASEVFGVPMEMVTREMRGAAKAVNFGLAYGQTDYGLSRSLGIPRAEAKAYIENYFSRYPGVRSYMERAVREASERGYATTLLGRKRPLPDINSRNRNLRQYAERTAINTPIQGTAADIIKLAMVAVRRGLKDAGVKARMLLQVHDELVLEVPESELEVVRSLVIERMEGAMALDVPLRVDPKQGANWYDMKPL